jgi:Cu+-exporting ATPase
LAQAITAAADARALPRQAGTNFQSVAGKGVSATANDRRILLGTALFLKENGIAAEPAMGGAQHAQNEGASVIFMGVDGKLAGAIAIADTIKPTTPKALEALRQSGVQVVMLTGDNRMTAQAIARHLDIKTVEAEILPAEKASIIAKLKREGRVVAMAGDGVNDAPALAAADVGIAMGTGSDIAKESAGITLLKGDLTGIVRARLLSHATMANIRQNLFFAFIYNAVGVPVAAGVLYPAYGILLTPVMASVAMALSSLSVIGNALRLRWA